MSFTERKMQFPVLPLYLVYTKILLRKKKIENWFDRLKPLFAFCNMKITNDFSVDYHMNNECEYE